MLVQPLGEGLGKPVGERLQQDVRIIVIVRLEAREMRLDAVARRHREAADPVAVGIDEIGEAHVRPALALGDLLAQEGHADMLLVLDWIDDIVALAAARPQPGDALARSAISRR